MATRAALEMRESEAQKRIDASAAILAKKHGIDAPVVPYERKPDHRMALFLETHADFYDALAGSKNAKRPYESPAITDIAAAEAEGVTLGTDVAPNGDPVVVTEDVKPRGYELIKAREEAAENAAADSVKAPAKKGKA
jgi:hypothetical protein